MKKIIKNIVLLTLAAAIMSSCKKDEDSPAEGDRATTDKVLNGVLEGKVTGFTQADSTAFAFNYLNPYEWSTSSSEYNLQSGASTAKVSIIGPGENEVDIYVERYTDYDNDNYSYIENDNWDFTGEISNADIEIYVQAYKPLGNGQTLYYYHYAYEEDITVHSVSFDKNTGEFSIDLTASFDETSSDGTTDNPGTITMKYSGKLYSDDVINKVGQ